MQLKFDSEGFRKDLRLKRLIEMEGGLREASKSSNVSAATLSRCENGRIPDLMTYAKLCRWMNISLDKHIKKAK